MMARLFLFSLDFDYCNIYFSFFCRKNISILILCISTGRKASDCNTYNISNKKILRGFEKYGLKIFLSFLKKC